MTLQRLRQTIQHLEGSRRQTALSLVHGESERPLMNITIGRLLQQQALQFGSKEILTVPWKNTHETYRSFSDRCRAIAAGLLSLGIRHGDRVAILAGNCAEYAELFFGTAIIGAILVVMNNFYTDSELKHALNFTGMLLFLKTLISGP